jgi:hypothetical protein
MEWEYSLYRIRYSAKTFNRRFNDEGMAGVLWAIYSLWGPEWNRYIEVDLLTPEVPALYLIYGRPLPNGKIDNFYPMSPSIFRPYLITELPFLFERNSDSNWDQYIADVEMALGRIVDQNTLPSNLIILNPIRQTTLILQYWSDSFLQGISEVQRWFPTIPIELQVGR